MALAQLGDFKAHLMALYHASRDWLAPEQPEFQQEMKKRLSATFSVLRKLFTSDSEHVEDAEMEIFDEISRLSVYAKTFRKHGLQVGEMSRVSQYISKLGVAMENMKVILN